MLAPAGNPIALGHRSKAITEFTGYRFVWLNSGTAALALSVLLAKTMHKTREPEVIIPAYACPDLVAACAYAGVKCRLCDLDQTNTAYSLDYLKNIINDNTVAIIAVNFLGIQEHLSQLQTIAEEHGIALIEDNAQWFPELADDETLTGDFVCLSFGRGKPVSLLGGGALLVKLSVIERYGLTDALHQHLPAHSTAAASLLLPKCMLYNCLIQPSLYALLNRLPGLTLGQTVYKPLTRIETADASRRRLLGLNIHRYQNSEPTAQNFLQSRLEQSTDELVSLPNKFPQRTRRLLRFPILLEDSVSRDSLLSELEQAGLGASRLYGKTLPEIPGTKPYLLDYEDLPNASDFAGRLITLPVHKLVKRHHLDSMIDIISVR